jgi:predicted ATP-binding protein involved in virulence
MGKETTEILEIHDFLSIKHVKWEFERFNIITGDMGSGKSLCIKLTQFFEDIILGLLVAPYEIFLTNLNINAFFSTLAHEFNTIFVLSANNSLSPFRIIYTFSYHEETFSVTVTGTDNTDIVFESPFLENLLSEWQKLVQENGFDLPEKITPDGFKEMKLSLYNDLLKKFGGYYPMATTFVPASRAALAFASSYNDNHLTGYKALIDVLPRYKSRNDKMIETILKAKMVFENGYLFLESDDGRKVPISKASSGQQEIVYVLMLLDKLGNFSYTYGRHHSVFIEEPSAHLFPLEQKQTIELIVQMYNYLKGNGGPVRFFITTHSPYVLNSLNNILKKGALLDKYKDQTEKINETIDIPHLYSDEVSAYFINNEGGWENMMDKDKKYLYAEKIAGISIAINENTITLEELNNELLNKKE